MTYETKVKIEAEAKKAEIFEPKYNGKDHSGYDTLMKYEVNDYLNEAFTSGASYGYNLAVEDMSKGGEFREYWILNESLNFGSNTSSNPKDQCCLAMISRIPICIDYKEKATHLIDIAALQAANAKNAELQQQVKELSYGYNLAVEDMSKGGHSFYKRTLSVPNTDINDYQDIEMIDIAALQAANAKNAELQQQVKELSHSTVLAANEVLKERVKELEQEEKALQRIAKDAVLAANKTLELAQDLDMHTVHTYNCNTNRSSINDCLCGLKESRAKLKSYLQNKGG